MADIHGVCEERFEAVRSALARNLDSGEELGASLVLDMPAARLMARGVAIGAIAGSSSART